MLPSTVPTQNDLITIGTVVGRMVKCAYGALATLPLFCLGELDNDQVQAVVNDHYEVWHSLLITALEILRTTSDPQSVEKQAVSNLLVSAETLRAAYLELGNCRRLPPARVQQAYDQMCMAYSRLHDDASDLDSALGLNISSVVEPSQMRMVVANRTLEWFGDELREICNKAAAVELQKSP